MYLIGIIKDPKANKPSFWGGFKPVPNLVAEFGPPSYQPYSSYYKGGSLVEEGGNYATTIKSETDIKRQIGVHSRVRKEILSGWKLNLETGQYDSVEGSYEHKCEVSFANYNKDGEARLTRKPEEIAERLSINLSRQFKYSLALIRLRQIQRKVAKGLIDENLLPEQKKYPDPLAPYKTADGKGIKPEALTALTACC